MTNGPGRRATGWATTSPGFRWGDLKELAAALRSEADRVDAERKRKKSAVGGAEALFRN